MAWFRQRWWDPANDFGQVSVASILLGFYDMTCGGIRSATASFPLVQFGQSHLSNFCQSSTDWFKGNTYRKPWFLHFLPSIIGVYCRFSQQQCILGLTLVPGNESLTYKDLSLGHLRSSTSMLSGDEARNWFNRHIQEKHALTSWHHDFYMVLPSHLYTFMGIHSRICKPHL